MSSCKFVVYASKPAAWKGSRRAGASPKKHPVSTNGYIDSTSHARKSKGYLVLECGKNELQLADCTTGRCNADPLLDVSFDPDLEIAGLRGLRRSKRKPTLYVIEKKKSKKRKKR